MSTAESSSSTSAAAVPLPDGDVHYVTTAHWQTVVQRLQRAGGGGREEQELSLETAQTCLALALFRAQRVQEAMPKLLLAVGRNPHDWVAHEHIAGGYGMLARRLASVAHRPELKTQWRLALDTAAKHFQLASLSRGRSDPHYPQKAFQQPASLVLRGWGDALNWLGRKEDAQRVFQQGVAQGMAQGVGVVGAQGAHQAASNQDACVDHDHACNAQFVPAQFVHEQHWRNALCRPSHSVAVTSPNNTFFFTASEFPHIYDQIRLHLPTLQRWLRAARAEEGGLGWRVETGGLHLGRSWSQLPLVLNGRLQKEDKEKRPRQSAVKSARSPCAHALLEGLCDALLATPALKLKNGQVKLSSMQPGTTVHPHAGPTNTRLRMHCALLVPSLSPGGAGGSASREGDGTIGSGFLRVGTDTQWWEEGQCFVFDESCEHEAQISEHASGDRVVLIIDFANPFMRYEEDYMATLSPLLDAAQITYARDEYRAFNRG